MRITKRICALLLVLCMALPLCLVNAGAEQVIPNSDYKLFHEELKALTYNDTGNAQVEKNKAALENLYNSGKMNITPYTAYMATKSEKYYINYSAANIDGSFPFDGIKRQQSVAGDWFAFKFRSPGTGLFSITAETFYLSKNHAAELTTYLLPGSTAKDRVGALLTDTTKVGLTNIPGETTNKTPFDAILTNGVELEAGKEYILVVQLTKDGYQPDTGRIDFSLTGISFGKGALAGEGAFGPVSGVEVADNFIRYAEYYRAVTGVNPENGHDLMYLMFKGGTIIVYDMDKKEIADVETGLSNTLLGGEVDKDGNLWVATAGAQIHKYNPITGKAEKYKWNYSVFDATVKGKTYSLTCGDDGYIYFAYWCWLGRLDPKTGNVEKISDALTSDPNVASDSQMTGYGGIIYQDGYLYTTLHGDLNNDTVYTSEVIKYDIANRKVVQSIDVKDVTWSEEYQSAYGVNYLDCIDGVLFGTLTQRTSKQIYIDITGEEMVRLDGIEGFDSCLISRFSYELDGKHYATGYVDMESSNKCLYEYDPATRTMTRLMDILMLSTLFSRDAVVTIDDPKLPGKSLVTAQNNYATGVVDLVFYNMQTRETVIIEGVSGDYGSPSQLHSIELDPTGRYLYAGAYGTNQLAKIDLETGEITTRLTHNHQIDGMLWYDGYLWVGNYSTGTITRFDPETEEVTPLFELMSSVFQCKRMWNFTAGDGMVFCATVPDTGRYGGVMVWYDMDKDLTYVAAGPNPEDVFYAQTTASFVVWRNAVTGAVENFDDDGDGMYDFNVLVDDKGTADTSDDIYRQRYNGVVENRVLTSINYVDGYIYGSTTKYNGQNTDPSGSAGNAEIFVYSLREYRLVATYDLTESIDGLINPLTGYMDAVDVVRPDPYEKGKFWGVVCDTLFSFTFDLETETFTVKEELSMAKDMTHAITQYGGRHIVFDGDYVIVSFHNRGTYMVNTADPTVNYQISVFTVDNMQMLPNGDILYIGGKDGSKYGVRKFEIGQFTQPIVAASVQAVIDALPETITMENEAQFDSAYRMYLDLTEDAKKLVDPAKLLAVAEDMNAQMAAKADALIDAIGEVTLQKEDAVWAARNYYNSLPEPAKALVTKLLELEMAEADLYELKHPKPQKPNVVLPEKNDPAPAPQKNNTLLFVIIGAAVVAGAAAATIVILKKKKKA